VGDDDDRTVYWRRASWKRSLVLRSRWFVGSSRMRRFVSSRISFRRARRDFSPPESTRTGLWMSSPEKRNPQEIAPFLVGGAAPASQTSSQAVRP
jgi:hypothetical protein